MTGSMHQSLLVEAEAFDSLLLSLELDFDSEELASEELESEDFESFEPSEPLPPFFFLP